jgi:hypothetical protein
MSLLSVELNHIAEKLHYCRPQEWSGVPWAEEAPRGTKKD